VAANVHAWVQLAGTGGSTQLCRPWRLLPPHPSSSRRRDRGCSTVQGTGRRGPSLSGSVGGLLPVDGPRTGGGGSALHPGPPRPCASRARVPYCCWSRCVHTQGFPCCAAAPVHAVPVHQTHAYDRPGMLLPQVHTPVAHHWASFKVKIAAIWERMECLVGTDAAGAAETLSRLPLILRCSGAGWAGAAGARSRFYPSRGAFLLARCGVLPPLTDSAAPPAALCGNKGWRRPSSWPAAAGRDPRRAAGQRAPG